MKPSTILSVLALALPFASATSRRRHHNRLDGVNHARAEVAEVAQVTDVEERGLFSAARFTFYDVGLGACGLFNTPDDMIVALNEEQFGTGYPGPNCFKTITITYGGKSTNATVVDRCEACPYGGLDFSRGLFNFFAEEALGVLYGQWSFND